ncbi:Mitogen-activated protein kinase-like NTF4 [Porphyridium purpureum]|uniref:Mitogen-activated protein kinase-like NTF4 n=1 Tax=Porphyridium purpureum TaxID=35688 RepID=A0A5J4YXH7_PORPP|nr:Mitogen-activated protein kinase-like NTF4 [Porphyridium purpureum]|eukprot:POR6431..scf209_3
MAGMESKANAPLSQVGSQFGVLAGLRQNRYYVKEMIGSGSYGVVCSGVDTVTNEPVAIKRMHESMSNYRLASRNLREIKFLRLLSQHENIINMKDLILAPSRENFSEIFLVLDLMPSDLSVLLRSKTKLQSNHTKYLMFQIARAIAFLHGSGVMHRDLKPSNILVNSKCHLFLCDFGMSRAVLGPHVDSETNLWTDYVSTRWYRAPELVLNPLRPYTSAIDMWAVGCIFFEILSRGQPLFPSISQWHHLQLILALQGFAAFQSLDHIMPPHFKREMAQHANQTPVSLSELLPHADPQALDLTSRMLHVDPLQRISARDALMHPYLIEFTKQLGYGAPPVVIDQREFEFEGYGYTEQQMRDAFGREEMFFHGDSGGFSGVDQGRLAQSFEVVAGGFGGKVSPSTLPAEQSAVVHGEMARAAAMSPDKAAAAGSTRGDPGWGGNKVQSFVMTSVDENTLTGRSAHNFHVQ